MNCDTIRSDSSEFEYLDSVNISSFSNSNPCNTVKNLNGGNYDVSMSGSDSMNFNELVQLEKNMKQILKHVDELEKKCENQEKKLKEFENRETENISPFSSSNLCKNIENLKIDRLGLTSERSDVSMSENDSMNFNQLVQLEKNMDQISKYVEELEKKCEKYEKHLNDLENREESEDQKGSVPSELSSDFDKIRKSNRNSSIELLQSSPFKLTLVALLILLPISYFILNFDTTRSDSSEFDYPDPEIESTFSRSNLCQNIENLNSGKNSDASKSENDSMSFNQIIELEKNMEQISKYVEELEKKCEKYEERIKELEDRETGNTLEKILDEQEAIFEQLSTHFDAIKKKEKRPKPEFLEDFRQLSDFPAKIQKLRKNLAILEARLQNPKLLDKVDLIRNRLIPLIEDQELMTSQMEADLEIYQRYENRVQKISMEIVNFIAVINSASNESIIEQIPKFRKEIDAIRDLWYLKIMHGKHLKADQTSFNLVIDNYKRLNDRVEKIFMDSVSFSDIVSFKWDRLGF